MVDARKFILNSNYVTPYIIKTFTASFTVTSESYGAIGLSTIKHNLPFTPLVIGVWYDSNEGVYRDISNQRPEDPFSMPEIIESVTSDSTNIYLEISDSKYPAEETTYSFRIACLSPPDFTGDVGVSASVDNTDFIVNTDTETPKILLFGKTTIAAGETATIKHDLGYAPMCRVWTNKILRYSTFTTATGLLSEAQVDNTNLYITNNISLSTATVYYMIFVNG